MGCSSAKERYGTPAAVIPPVEPKEVKDRPPEADSKGARPAEWQRPATWPARKKVPPPGRDAPHVVLSTKFVEPWGTISRGFKEILEEKGCTVYNPNTDNLAIYGDDEAAANDAWLDTGHLEEVKRTKGFVLQIQQGAVREKTKMQEAEERMGGWLDVPRIATYAFPLSQLRGGGSNAEEEMAKAIAAAQAQWSTGVWPGVQMVSEVFEPLDGELRFDVAGEVEGKARCVWPDGAVYEGSWLKSQKHGHGVYKYADGATHVGQYEHGLMHGHGTYKWPDGATYVGQYENDFMHGHGTHKWPHGDAYSGDYENNKMHGRGTYSHAGGDVYVGFYEADRRKGAGIYMHKASGSYLLLTDGRGAREISRAQAGQSDLRAHFLLRQAEKIIKEHSLPELPS